MIHGMIKCADVSSSSPRVSFEYSQTPPNIYIPSNLIALLALPEQITNGDILKAVFPEAKCEERKDVVLFTFGGCQRELPIGWWKDQAELARFFSATRENR